MRIITEQDLRTTFPGELSYFEGLSGGQRETYLYLTTVYRKLLNAYVAYEGLRKYDIALHESDRVPVPVPERDYDFYQHYANSDLIYFYVRNNTYIERLSSDEMGFLRERVGEHNLSLDLDSHDFVRDTFAKVIRERWAKRDEQGRRIWSDEDAEVNFGPSETRFFCPNGALVLGCRIADGQDGEIAQDVRDCNALLTQSLGRRLAVPLSVVVYDSSSVRALNSAANQGE